MEACRQRQAVAIPADLQANYVAALAALPGLVAQAATRAWDSELLACALAALAAAKGFGFVAEAALELTPEVAEEFLEWFHLR